MPDWTADSPGVAVQSHVDLPCAGPVPPASVRLRLDLSYDGTNFAGWATQPSQRTVQECLESALCTLLRVQRLRVAVAGRTDAGVHATGQVAHVDVPLTGWSAQADRAARSLTGLLPGDIRITRIQPAAPGFDARFSAVWRRYRYLICDAEAGPEPLRRFEIVRWRRRLNAAAMHDAAQALVGLQDFAAFCRRRPGSTTIRQLLDFNVRRDGDVVSFELRADAFCHSMVRSLVGALAAVGDGSQPADWPLVLLARSERSERVTVAPPHGLTLLQVGYPPDAELAARAELTRAVRATAVGPS